MSFSLFIITIQDVRKSEVFVLQADLDDAKNELKRNQARYEHETAKIKNHNEIVLSELEENRKRNGNIKEKPLIGIIKIIGILVVF